MKEKGGQCCMYQHRGYHHCIIQGEMKMIRKMRTYNCDLVFPFLTLALAVADI
jgi:hypothetical protein